MQTLSLQPLVLVISHSCVLRYPVILDQANCVFQMRLTNVKGALNSRLLYSYTQRMASGMLSQVSAGLVQQCTMQLFAGALDDSCVLPGVPVAKVQSLCMKGQVT